MTGRRNAILMAHLSILYKRSLSTNFQSNRLSFTFNFNAKLWKLHFYCSIMALLRNINFGVHSQVNKNFSQIISVLEFHLEGQTLKITFFGNCFIIVYFEIQFLLHAFASLQRPLEWTYKFS